MEHNTDTVMTCNNCESQEFSTLEYAGEHFYQCFHCGAVDDHRMAPEREELELKAVSSQLSAIPRKPASRETQAILRQAASIRRIREELIEELS